ncbi:MAG: hypothetical protein RMJ32_05890 [Aquificaceae bacterium]|nr:hypothetical protein [Aquificaceae bacterium]MDW8237918.1 hypothetical protein [Aquificaceae bacterium]
MSFQERIKFDNLLKDIVSNFFGSFLNNKIFVKNVGQEEIFNDVHQHMRYKRDKTTEFIRYMPDLFILWHKSFSHESWLIELKSAFTGLKSEDSWIIKKIREKKLDVKKEEILNIELGSWNNLVSLSKIGVKVAIFAFVNFHPQEKWLVILPCQELNLLEVSSGEMAQTSGSGTPIANIFTRVDNTKVMRAQEWLSREFEVNKNDVEEFLKTQETHLLEAWNSAKSDV